MSTLFDDIIRTDERSARQDEPRFSYMNQSAREVIAEGRVVLEEWFAYFPANGKADVRGRFRNNDNRQHNSAFFELYLNEFLRRLGYTAECHPDTTEPTHPDFKVFRNGEPCFYMEAVVPQPADAKSRAEESRLARLIDGLNKIQSPRCSLWVTHKGKPTDEPNMKRVNAQVRRWLDTLTEADLDPNLERYDLRRSQLRISEAGLDISIRPVPKSEKASADPDFRTVGVVGPGEAACIDTVGTIHRAVASKASKYGELDLPYVLAVNVLDYFVDLDDVFSALLGREQMIFLRDAEGEVETKGHLTRASDGAWLNHTGPIRQGISGLLVAFELCVWNVHERFPVLIHHPEPNRPLGTGAFPLEQWVAPPDEDYYGRQDGQDLSGLFA